MLPLSTMLVRIGLAALLGALVGCERESIGKEAGIRTDMLVSAGAALFSIIALALPFVISVSPENLPDVVARNSGFLAVIANIVVGIGFLGAGIIIHEGLHVRGLTTAATVWFVAGIGVLCGIGLAYLAVIVTIAMIAALILLRPVDIKKLNGGMKRKKAKAKPAA